MSQLTQARPAAALVEQGLHRPICAQHEQPRRITATRHIANPFQRRPVAPVQILEDEDQRFGGREHSTASASSRSIRPARTGVAGAAQSAASEDRCSSQLGALLPQHPGEGHLRRRGRVVRVLRGLAGTLHPRRTARCTAPGRSARHWSPQSQPRRLQRARSSRCPLHRR